VSDVRNEIKTAGYGLTNLRTSYTWKQVRVDLGVENLFDKFYACRSVAPMSARARP
jgi:iron complex outermembrane receptor protein